MPRREWPASKLRIADQAVYGIACAARSAFADTPIVTLTAYGSEAAEEAKRCGASAVFAKPMEFAELVSEVRRLLAPPAGG